MNGRLAEAVEDERGFNEPKCNFRKGGTAQAVETVINGARKRRILAFSDLRNITEGVS